MIALGLVQAALATFSLVTIYAVTGIPVLYLTRAYGLTPPGSLLLAPFLGWALTTLVAAWAVTLGLTPGSCVLAVVVCIALVAFFLGRKRSFPLRVFHADLFAGTATSVLLTVLIFGCLAVITAVLASVSDSGQIVPVFSVGPDAVGYAISGQMVALGASPSDVSNFLASVFPDIASNLVLSPLTGAVYEIDSFTRQVQAEFMVGAGRVGWAGPQGLMIDLVGFKNTWFVQTTMMASSLMISIMVFAHVARTRTLARQRITVFAISGTSGSVVLYSWHQGGAGQIWILPAFVALSMALAGCWGHRLALVVGSLAVSVLACSYFDGLFLALLVLGGLAAMRWARFAVLPGLFSRSLGVIVVGLLLFPQAITRVPSYLLARSLDSAQAGWQIPTDLNLASLLGAMPLLNGPVASFGGDLPGQMKATAIGLVLPVAILLIAVVILRRRQGRPTHGAPALGVVALCVLVAVFVVNQYFSGQTNYSVFKAAVLLIPVAIAGLLLTGSGSWKSRAISSSWLVFAARPSFHWFVALGLSVLVLSNSIMLSNEYRSSATYFPQAAHLSYSNPATEFLDSSTFVIADRSWASVALGTVGDFNYANRGYIGQLVLAGVDRQVVLVQDGQSILDIIEAMDSGRGQTLPEEVRRRGAQIISSTAQPLMGLSSEEVCVTAGILWAGTGLEPIMGCDPKMAGVGANFLGRLSTGEMVREAPCPVAPDIMISALIDPATVGLGRMIMSTGASPGGFEFLLGTTGEFIIVQKSSLWRFSIGWLNPDRSNVLVVKFSDSGLETELNGQRRTAVAPRSLVCSKMSIADYQIGSRKLPGIRVVVSAQ